VATCAQLLAAELGYPNFSLAYTAGLFHDFGTAILNTYAFDEISQAIKLTEARAMALFTAEDRALGFNHSYFGAKVLSIWGMHPSIVNAAAFHHRPKEAPDHGWLVKIIHLADVAVYCQQTKLPIGIALFPVDKALLAELPFPKEKLLALAAQAAEEVAAESALQAAAPVS
jgi:putative nucleotidyltransferase with HDIG domain